jgi:CheY-like chemotaxis protein
VLVLLPATSAAASTAARPPRRAREGTVLIVDDEPTVRDVLRLQLERLGYRTRAVENGLLALEHVRAHAGELLAVVLDQTMPVMGGAEAYRHLREIAPRLPVVLTTGYGEENLLELIAGDVHAAFLPKPFALGRLREVLEHVTS